MKQEQFLDVVSLQEARRRWDAALDLSPRRVEAVPLEDALGRVLGADHVPTRRRGKFTLLVPAARA